jgi:hypothetical protein
MTKQELLDTLMLLSAMESWSFSMGKPMPAHLHKKLTNCVERLSKELLVDRMAVGPKTPIQIGGKCLACGEYHGSTNLPCPNMIPRSNSHD